MAKIKSYSDLKQSKKLTKILPLESADMYYPIEGASPKFGVALSINNIPCWSLAALLGVLPKYIGDYSKCLYYDGGNYYCGYMDDGDFMLTIEEIEADNPVDACVAMIEKLHELKML